MKSPKDPVLLEAFAAELKAARGASGQSQEALALAAGLNRTFVAKLELAQTSPSLSTLFSLANALGTEPGALVHSVVLRRGKLLKAARAKK